MEEVINLNNIFYKSYSVDPNTGHSIYVFDSTYLPSAAELGVNDKNDYDEMITELMDMLVKKLPQAPFSLVIFSSGFSAKKISWVYGVKMYSKLPKLFKKYLQETYIVHESFFVRTVYQVLSNAMNFKFLTNNKSEQNGTVEDESRNGNAIRHVSTLSELACMIDITRLRISLNVYLHDSEVTGEYFLSLPDYYTEKLSPTSKRQYRQIIFDKIFNRLKYDALTNELVFQRPGSYKKVNILLSIIERNNYIDLSQWDIYSLASIFTNFLKNKSKPLIPIDLIELPIHDNFEYTFQVFKEIVRYNNYYDILCAIFPLFISILNAGDITRHDSRSLSRALTPTLCKEKVSMMSSDRLAIGNKYIRNLFEHFHDIIKVLETNETRNEKISKSDIAELANLTINTHININSRSSSGSSDLLLDINSDRSGSVSSSPKIPPKLPPRRNASSELKLAKEESSIQRPVRAISLSHTNSEDESNTSLPSVNSTFSKASSSTDSTNIEQENKNTDINNDNTNDKDSPVKTERNNNDIQNMITDGFADVDVSQVVLKKGKIQEFDKELQKKKKLAGEENTVKTIKFSTESYSDIKTNKVSKLAALYEERLMGLQVMNEIRHQNSV